MSTRDTKAKLAAALLPHANKVDITTWTLIAFEEFKASMQKGIRDAASEALTIAVTEYPCEVWFPHTWNVPPAPQDGINGPPPSDPMTIYVMLPLGPTEGTGPTWGFSLRDLLQNLIDDRTTRDGALPLTDETRCVAQIRDELLEIVARIDVAFAKGASLKSGT